MGDTDASTSQGNKSEGSLEGALIGFVFLLLIGFGIYEGVTEIRKYYKGPAPVIALSAYFVDETGNPISDSKTTNSHLRISGEVTESGAPLKVGKVRLTVGTLDQTFQQSVIVDLKDGHFESQDPAFNALEPEDQIHITGEVLSSTLGPPEELYLNTKPPKITSDALWEIAIAIGIIVFAIFFYAFTGKRTPWKNRWAIIFSYCVIGFFLVIPLIAPVLFVSNDRHSTITKPVGLVLTRIGPPPEGKIQWALNIGGYATVPTPTPTPSSSASPTSSPVAGATKAPVVGPSPQSTRPAANASPSAQPTSTPQPSATPPTRANAAGPSPTVTPTPNAARCEDCASSVQQAIPENDNVVEVQGGLVIPLYIIILSVIGGAINMTRKVPQLQQEGEYTEGVEGSFISKIPLVGSSVARYLGKSSTTKIQDQANTVLPEKPATPDPGIAVTEPPTQTVVDPQKTPPTPADRAKAIDTELAGLVDEQTKRKADMDNTTTHIRDLIVELKKIFAAKKDDELILDSNSFDDWMRRHAKLKDLLGSPWRVELLNQYMYLVSAPFLAIVAYYMLDLLGLTKQPILVLISFSVGLISEKILTWLLGLASGYLRSDTSQAPTKPT